MDELNRCFSYQSILLPLPKLANALEERRNKFATYSYNHPSNRQIVGRIYELDEILDVLYGYVEMQNLTDISRAINR